MRTHAYRVVAALLAVGMSVAGLTACSNDSGASDGDVEDDTAVEELAIDQSSPAATVTTMLNAWQAGRPDVVEELIHPDEADDDKAVQTVEQAADALALPENGEVVNTEYTDSGAKVDYTFEIDGETYKEAISLKQGGPSGTSWYVKKYEKAFAYASADSLVYDIATVGGVSVLDNGTWILPGEYQAESSFELGSYSGTQMLEPDDSADLHPSEDTEYDTDKALQLMQETLIAELNDESSDENSDCKSLFENLSNLYDKDALVSGCQALTDGVTPTVSGSDYRSVVDVTEEYTLESAEPTGVDSIRVTFAAGRQRQVQATAYNTVGWSEEIDTAGCIYSASIEFLDDNGNTSMDFSGDPLYGSPESCPTWNDMYFVL